jgi:tripartite-type tricarboxylate transporter receptor subunit TctC
MKCLGCAFLHLSAGTVFLAVFSGMAGAQSYPTRPMTMIVPFAAGGPQDVLGRIVAQRASEILGQQIVVENIGGAGGTTGSKRVADAQPNGYTMGIGSVGTHAHNQTLYKKPQYDASADFSPVALIAETPVVLITRKDLPPNNFQEFIAYTKANQAKMQFGTPGAGSSSHIACVILNSIIGTMSRTCPIVAALPPCRILSAAGPTTNATRSSRPSLRSTAAM